MMEDPITDSYITHIVECKILVNSTVWQMCVNDEHVTKITKQETYTYFFNRPLTPLTGQFVSATNTIILLQLNQVN